MSFYYLNLTFLDFLITTDLWMMYRRIKNIKDTMSNWTYETNIKHKYVLFFRNHECVQVLFFLNHNLSCYLTHCGPNQSGLQLSGSKLILNFGFWSSLNCSQLSLITVKDLKAVLHFFHVVVLKKQVEIRKKSKEGKSHSMGMTFTCGCHVGHWRETQGKLEELEENWVQASWTGY